MNDRTYKKVMNALGEDLERINSTKPYDYEAYGETMLSIHRTNQVWLQSRRRRDWVMILLLWISGGALVGFAFRILFMN